MEESPCPINCISGSSAAYSYPSPASCSPHLGQPDFPLPQVPQPPQPSTTGIMQPPVGSNAHTPRTNTPNTPNSAKLNPSYPQTSQPGNRGGMYSSVSQRLYPNPQQHCASGPMMPQSAVSASHPETISPARAGGRGPPDGVSSPYGPDSLMQPSSVMQSAEQPAHVIRSQGRRGILLSAPGRPAAPAAGTSAAKNTVIPVKDANGRFPCPHCTKTYLHAKHLKRHLLRHTGDRPYACALCRDTFSRSDILKRHFQKCSVRRGNGTGASHLHPLVKKNQQAQNAAGVPEGGDMNQMNGMPSDAIGQSFGVVPVQDNINGKPGDQNPLYHSSSIGRMDDANGDRNVAPVTGTSHSHGGDVGSTKTKQVHGYHVPPGQNVMPMGGSSASNQQSNLDWSRMFQAENCDC